MKKLLCIAALIVAGAALCFADAVEGGAFEGLACEAELGSEAMASIDGQFFWIWVPFNRAGTATVITRERGDYCEFHVAVTTVAKAKDPSNPPADSTGRVYSPTPLPVGTYKLGNTHSMSNPEYGTGISINASVSTPYKDGQGSYDARDYFIHQTTYGNTWGCVGVQSGMDRVMNSYQTSTGTRKISVR